MTTVEKMRQKIETYLENGDANSAKEGIAEYESIYPEDMAAVSYRIVYEIYYGDRKKAKEMLENALMHYPTVSDFYFNLGYLYELDGNLKEAYTNYIKARYIFEYTNSEKNKQTNIDSIIQNIEEQILVTIEECTKLGLKEELVEFQKLIQRSESMFGLNDVIYNGNVPVIGQNRWLSDKERRYIAYKDEYSLLMNEESSMTLLGRPAEMLKVNCGRVFNYCESKTALLPIATENDNTTHTFITQKGKFESKQQKKKHFNYYRLDEPTDISSSGISYYGEPILLEHSKKRKKLVLNIFVDGLSQVVLNDAFEDLMPNTYRFFDNSIMCTNAYSSGEWTYPSIASLVSGLEIKHHMMFHPNIGVSIPENVQTLAEYFKHVGYYTAKIDSEWRSTPRYGHTRGYDRYIYHNRLEGSDSKKIVGELIDHIETFKDTDMFLWTCISDLHDVADGYEINSVAQAKLSLQQRIPEEKGLTSVKQFYSENKIDSYKKMIHYVDVHLASLYDYIKRNYREDEVVIGLFADHGQGYLVPDKDHFISKNRTNIAFMFKDGKHSFRTDEMISICDYIPIICKLSGIIWEKGLSDANLPIAFGGDIERDYVISESYHPNDNYCATLYYKNRTVYYETIEKTDDEGQINISGATVHIVNSDGTVIDDEAKRIKIKNMIEKRMSKHIKRG